MPLSREEMLRLREIERRLSAEEPELDRALRGRTASRRPCLVSAKALGLLWLPIMIIGYATEQMAFAVVGIVLLLTALTLAMIGLTR